jgi:hypothetical protein
MQMYTSTSHVSSWNGVYLIMHGHNFVGKKKKREKNMYNSKYSILLAYEYLHESRYCSNYDLGTKYINFYYKS